MTTTGKYNYTIVTGEKECEIANMLPEVPAAAYEFTVVPPRTPTPPTVDGPPPPSGDSQEARRRIALRREE